MAPPVEMYYKTNRKWYTSLPARLQIKPLGARSETKIKRYQRFEAKMPYSELDPTMSISSLKEIPRAEL